MESRKLATLDLSPELFLAFCKFCKDGPPRMVLVKENPLPDDAEIIQIRLRPDGFYPNELQLVIRSESFADVRLGDGYPELPLVVFETIYDEVAV
jgi:hypothetical protein